MERIWIVLGEFIQSIFCQSRNLSSKMKPFFPEVTYFSFRFAIVFSFLLHLGCLGILFSLSPPKTNSLLKIQPHPGGNPRLRFTFSRHGRQNSQALESTNPREGATDISKEIHRFLSDLKYPLQALEKGLESDCNWVVMVAENGRNKILEESGGCKYKVFDTYLRQKLEDWDFQVQPNTVLKIPIRFRIKKND